MDIAMPEMDGIESTRKALERKPDLKIIVLSILGDEEYYSRMIEAGAKGFVSKEAKSAELINAIHEVADHGTFFSQELLRKIIFNQNRKQKRESKVYSIVNEFSERELQVLALLCQGMTNSEIGQKLFLSTRTIEGHRAHLLRKTGTKNTVGLIMFALQHEIIKVIPE
jgi:DNA-binding NarL/FixJ family response regulator